MRRSRDRLDMMNGISTATQNTSANSHVAAKPYRISDLIPRELGGLQLKEDNSDT